MVALGVAKEPGEASKRAREVCGHSRPWVSGEELRLIDSRSREGFSEAGVLNRVLEGEWEFFRLE